MQYNIVGSGDEQVLVVFDPSYSRPQSIHSSHPRFEGVKAAVESGGLPEESAFDPAEQARGAFEAIGDRVTVRGGQVYLDGDPIDNSCTKAIIEFMSNGEPFEPLVNFFEKVQGNPSPRSREQLYSFLAANDYTITDEGKGFDVSKVPNPHASENLERLNGRGIFISRVNMTQVTYNKKGNSVTLYKELAVVQPVVEVT